MAASGRQPAYIYCGSAVASCRQPVAEERPRLQELIRQTTRTAIATRTQRRHSTGSVLKIDSIHITPRRPFAKDLDGPCHRRLRKSVGAVCGTGAS